MAGKKGRSGRKPNSDGKKMRAVNLYIPMYNMDTGTGFGQGKAKFEWIAESWFRQFKRIYGSRWQEKVRNGIRNMVKDYEAHSMWDCKCQGRMKSTHFMHEARCPRCDYEPNDLNRYKSIQNARIHQTDDPKKKPLSLCPTCRNPLVLQLDIHGRKLMVCKKC